VTGRLITFEGGDGAGKSTQLPRLAGYLDSLGIPVVCTREPGGAPEAEAIRELLVSGRAEWDPLSEAMLHYAARREHVEKRIRPALEAGQWVLSDRFYDSTVAYQCYGQGVALEDEALLRRLAIGELRPDLTVFLNISVAAARKRRQARKPSRYEAMAESVHRSVLRGFIESARLEPDRIAVVDAETDCDSVAAEVRALVARRFNLP